MLIIGYLPHEERKPIRVDKDYIRIWLRACFSQGGTPIFRPTIEGYISAICYGGIGPEISQHWIVPEDLKPILLYERGKEKLRHLLEIVDPELLKKMEEEFNKYYTELLKYLERMGKIILIDLNKQ